MLEMGLIAINSCVLGFDIVWDKDWFNFLWKYFKEGIHLAEKRSKERKVKLRLIVEITKENMDSIKSISYHEIRHIDNIRSNFAILNNRAYMVQIFHKESEPPAQVLFSNTKALVDSQQVLFNRLWEIATPITNRLKEIEYRNKLNHQRILTNPREIQNEINSLIEQCDKELLIFKFSLQLLTYLDSSYTIIQSLKVGYRSQIETIHTLSLFHNTRLFCSLYLGPHYPYSIYFISLLILEKFCKS